MMLKGWVVAAVFTTGCLERPIVEAAPKTSNVYVGQVPSTRVDKIDLLFMVDNSASMADKQEILQSAVPVLVRRLTSPICVDAVSGAPTGESSSGGACKNGVPEFQAVADIHVGIVTSSLGLHGAAGSCTLAKPGSTPDDRAHLLGSVRPTGGNNDPKLVFDSAKTWNNTGFLAWDANQRDLPPGASDPTDFKNSFRDMIAASGEQGCGYEASLEAWYRFLVDPEPPAHVTATTTRPVQTLRGSALIKNADGSTTCTGCDMELLAQRKAFLRPDSLVAIVMLSDENDCSIRDDGLGSIIATPSDDEKGPYLPHATAACANNPNDPCCRSCAQIESTPPPGCPALADDAVCKVSPIWDKQGDRQNLRCYAQKRRFGFDLLYPTSRYVDALTQPMLTLQSDGVTRVPNPLYASASGLGQRGPAQIFLAGIVGVPWQDIADDASLKGPGLTYLSAKQLTDQGRWPLLIGDPTTSPPTPPSDPFMVETPSERAGANPITHDPIVRATSTNPTASPINGHEQEVPKFDDLQYACTFPLTTPRQCSAGGAACDCSTDPATANSPLCQPPGGGAASTLQSYAKAYPGTRELEVLKGMNEQGIVASICPKLTASDHPDSDPSYGYNPAVAAIIDRLKIFLAGKCLPRAVEADPTTHQVLCKVVEVSQTSCDCGAPGRGQVDPDLVPAVQRELERAGRCGGAGQAACSSFCECEILQETAEPNLNACRLGQPPPAGSPPGYCYIDDPSSPLLKNCPDNQKHKLQFVSTADQPTPLPGAVTVVACLGAAIVAAQAGAGH